MRALFGFLFILSSAVSSMSAVHAAQWARSYGGLLDDSPVNAQPTADGGYIVAGITGVSSSLLASDVWVLKLDASGNVIWQKSYGGTESDGASAVRSTADGGYVVAGYTRSSGVFDAWLLKLDGGGSVVWQRTYGGTSDDLANDVQPTADGGYIVAGSTVSFGAGSGDAWVLKLDASGNVAWQKTYGGVDSDNAASVRPTADGGYIVAGTTFSFGAGKSDAWVLKLDPNGDVVWQKTYGGAGNDFAQSVRPTAEGSYIVVGSTDSFGLGSSDAWVLKLDASGNVIWQKTFGGSGQDFAGSVEPTTDGGYIVGGYMESSFTGQFNALVLKMNAGGDILWQDSYDGAVAAKSVQPTIDGGYIVAGLTAWFGGGRSDAWVAKLDAQGSNAGCARPGTSNAVPASTNATVRDSTARMAATNVVPVVTAVTPTTLPATPLQECHSIPPVVASIPMLSEWTTRLLIIALGLSGAMAILRYRPGRTKS